MGIRFYCPRGHKLNVKAELAGKVGFCPECGQRVLIPIESTRESSHQRKLAKQDGFAPDSEETSLTLHQPPGGLPPGSQFPPELPGDPANPSAETSDAAAINDDAAVAQVNNVAADNTPDAVTAVWPSEQGPNGTLISPNTESETNSPGDSAADTDRIPQTEPPVEKPAPTDEIDANPLLDDPNLVWYARTADNQSYGPVTNIVMKSWIREKRVGPAMLVWREGWTSWLEARNVFPELEKIFSETPPPKISDSAAENAPEAADGGEPGDIHFPKSLLEVAGMEASSETAHKKLVRKKKKNREVRDLALVIGLIVVILLLIIILVVILMSQSGGETAVTTALTMLVGRAFQKGDA